MSFNNRDDDSQFAGIVKALLDSSPNKRKGTSHRDDSLYKALLEIKPTGGAGATGNSIFGTLFGEAPDATVQHHGHSLADLLSATPPKWPASDIAALFGSPPNSLGGSVAVPGGLAISNSLRSELESEVSEIFRSAWDSRDGYVVPDEDSVNLGNEAVKLEATVLYADLADSTKLVDENIPDLAAEVYKAFLHCAAKVINSEDGEITAYDGDRIVAVYVGDIKNTQAVRSAMKIKHVVDRVINPALRAQYGTTAYQLRHVIGIDTSKLFVAKTGVRLANDLVWVGRAANFAAKLSALPPNHSTYITKEVYDVIQRSVKVSSDGRSMWESVRWNTFDDRIIYRSTWGYSFS